MKLITSIALSGMLILQIPSAFAETNPWQDCGIGAMVFDNDTGAAISNIIWDLGTTAVSSNISSQDNCNGKKAQTAIFIKRTYNNIIEETAIGEGEHITAMFDLFKLDTNKREQAIEAIRTDMTALLASSNYIELSQSDKAEKYFNSLINNAS